MTGSEEFLDGVTVFVEQRRVLVFLLVIGVPLVLLAGGALYGVAKDNADGDAKQGRKVVRLIGSLMLAFVALITTPLWIGRVFA